MGENVAQGASDRATEQASADARPAGMAAENIRAGPARPRMREARALHTLQRSSEMPWEGSTLSWCFDEDDECDTQHAEEGHDSGARMDASAHLFSSPSAVKQLRKQPGSHHQSGQTKAHSLSTALGTFALHHSAGAVEEDGGPVSGLPPLSTSALTQQQARMLLIDPSELSLEALTWSSSTVSKSSIASLQLASSPSEKASSAAPRERVTASGTATPSVRERMASLREARSGKERLGGFGGRLRFNSISAPSPGSSSSPGLSASRTISRDASATYATADGGLVRKRSHVSSGVSPRQTGPDAGALTKATSSVGRRSTVRFSSSDLDASAVPRRMSSADHSLSTTNLGKSRSRSSVDLLPTFASAGAVSEWLGWMVAALRAELRDLGQFVRALEPRSGQVPLVEDVDGIASTEAQEEQRQQRKKKALAVLITSFFKWFSTFEQVMAAHLDFVDFSLIPFERRHRETIRVQRQEKNAMRPTHDPVDETHVEIMLKISKIRMTRQIKSQGDVVKQLVRNAARLVELAEKALERQLDTAHRLDGMPISQRQLAGLQSAQLKELRASALKAMPAFALALFVAQGRQGGAHEHSELVEAPTREWAAAVEKMFSPRECTKRSRLVPSLPSI
ncbi:hypothetical protein FVE85_6914 [Porphyridium purpureum]|uniref:Uncharacterized protein n=1 Tax=Porphyridium purpureum TaxID=35688 RepID=A0A5J4Z5J8_PORPP|nr:hypothetical protein FVE85_6914 [Porphyridium purpureum]|eukprot:POR5486..scf295_1